MPPLVSPGVQLPGSVSPAPSSEPVEPIGPSLPTGPVYADVGFEVFGAELMVEVRQAGRPVPNAWVRLLGPSLAGGQTDASGRLRLKPLLPARDYRMCVEAPDFVTVERGPFEIKTGEESLRLDPIDLKPAARVRGRVMNGANPVVGAVVSDGSGQTLTDANGRYELRTLDSGVLTLTASKPRFTLATRSVTTQAGQWLDADLVVASAPAKVYFDHGVAAGVAPSEMRGLRDHLTQKGWQLLDSPPGGEADGVWVMLTPGRDLSSSEQERVLNFVAQGGKFILVGDWAGSKGFRTSAANEVLRRLGLHISPDLVRDFSNEERPSWLTIKRFQAKHPVTAGVSALQLYGSASVFGLFPMLPLAQTGDKAFRVQAGLPAGTQDVIVGGPFKGGKALVVGDVSAFLDEDTDANGRSNIDEADNKRLFEQLLDW